MKEYYKAIHAIIKTGHWITDQISIELKDFDISEPQYNVLRILKAQKKKPIAVQEIQNLMVQRTSNVTRIIDKLLNKELVVRIECPSNRRKMDITITDKGLNLLNQLDVTVRAFHQPMADNLNTEELKKLTELIAKIKTT